MKTILAALMVLAAGACFAASPVYKEGPTGNLIISCEDKASVNCSIDADVIKALELAVKRTAMKNDSNIVLNFSAESSYIGLPEQPPETPANKKRREAKEALERAEREAANMEQNDKDVQFIRDVLKRVKEGK